MANFRSRGEKTRDAQRTRNAILDAAEAVFAQHGFHGARVDVIATASDYNSSLIFRYFGDKLGLYTEVLKRVDRDLNEVMAHVYAPIIEDKTAISDTHQFRNFLIMMIQTLFDFLLGHPHLVRILTWEMADEWQMLKQLTYQFPREDIEKIEAYFHKAQSAGLLRSKFFPVIQHAMVLQIFQVYLASIPLYQRLLPGEDISSTEAVARARDYFVDFIANGMMVDSEEKKPMIS
jgi:TetR/AcrR family transcriptional regulator